MAYQDPTIPDPREGNLPKWAQDLLNDLRRITNEAREGADDARLATDPFGSDMLIDAYDRIPIGLGTRPKLKVVLGRRQPDGDPIDYVDVRLTEDGKGIELMGSATLSIRPQVTNVIQVRPDLR